MGSKAFSVRDLRQRSGELLRNAEEGHMALITKHGRPAILAIPFDDQLLELGVHRTLALKLFAERQLTLVQAAKAAGMVVEDFMDLLGQTGATTVDYSPAELDGELRTAL